MEWYTVATNVKDGGMIGNKQGWYGQLRMILRSTKPEGQDDTVGMGMWNGTDGCDGRERTGVRVATGGRNGWRLQRLVVDYDEQHVTGRLGTRSSLVRPHATYGLYGRLRQMKFVLYTFSRMKNASRSCQKVTFTFQFFHSRNLPFIVESVR